MMDCVRIIEPGRVVMDKAPAPDCPPGGVRVKVVACGVCAADRKMAVNGHRALVYPRIPGHEIAGVVDQSRHQDYQPGDRVQVAPGLRCGRCRFCLAGTDNQCRSREILGFTRDGGFSQYISVPLQGDLVGALVPLPPTLTYEAATLAEPLACCIHAQQRISLGNGDRVLILGAGPLGLLHLALARRRSAGRVLVVEVDAGRRRLALNHGADQVFDPAGDALDAQILEATGGEGVDVLILACSGRGFDRELTRAMAPAGRVVLFSGLPGPPLSVMPDANLVHYHEWTLTGAYGCTANDNTQAVNLLADSAFNTDHLRTAHIAMADVPGVLCDEPDLNELKIIMEEDDDGTNG